LDSEKDTPQYNKHRIVNKITTNLKEETLCTAVFLHIAQAFDKVWHTGLLYKIKNAFPSPYYLLLKSYITERHFQIKYNNSYSDCYQVKSGVPQGSMMGPLLLAHNKQHYNRNLCG
jgi:hypothetical protein